MESLPFDLIKAYLPWELLGLTCKRYEYFLTLIKKPWVFDGVLVNTLKCRSLYTDFWFEVTRTRDVFIGWYVIWGNSSKRHALKLSTNVFSSFRLTHEYMFKQIADTLRSSLDSQNESPEAYAKHRICSYHTDVIQAFNLCIFRDRCECMMNALLECKRDEPILPLNRISYHLGPLMKRLPNDVLMSINDELKPNPYGSLAANLKREADLIAQYSPDYHLNQAKYRYHCLRALRFNIEIEDLLHIDTLKHSEDLIILEEYMVCGLRIGLVCSRFGTDILPNLVLLN